MKLAASKKITSPSAPTRCQKSTPSQDEEPPSNHQDGDYNLFFRAMIKAAGISQKELQYDLRVSRTLVQLWMSGEKNDPFKQARRAVSVFLNAAIGPAAGNSDLYRR
jgi:ribosome-binding protein aMBF1 (putative translation factor)